MIKSPDFWKSSNILSIVLFPISFIYLFVLKLYQIFTKETFIDIPIICVGNIVVGGSGKTPLVIKIRKLLNNYNKIFVLTRGYKGSEKGPIIVSKHSTYQEVGDESLIHAKYGLTCVSKNKRLGAFLCKKEKANLIIMDDGLQSKDLVKKIKILVIDADYGFGNRFLLPAGPLRDTINNAISECDFVIVFGNPKDERFKKITNKEKLFFAQKIITIKKLRKNDIYAFSGLGNNENFFNQLKNNKFRIIKFKSFSDHFNYSEQDLKKIINEAEELSLPIVCTEKDYVKIPKQFRRKIYVAKLDVKIFSSKTFINSLKKKLIKS